MTALQMTQIQSRSEEKIRYIRSIFSVLGNPVFKDLFNALRINLRRKWSRSRFRAEVVRADIHRKLPLAPSSSFLPIMFVGLTVAAAAYGKLL